MLTSPIAHLTSCRAAEGRAAAPEKLGSSSGPVQKRVPRSAPASGNGSGRTPSVSRSALTSTSGTVAWNRYSPASGFRSMSPACIGCQ